MQSFVYVSNAGDRSINAFRVGAQVGDLTPIGTFDIPGPQGADAVTAFSSPMAVSPDQGYLFVTFRVGQEPPNEPWAVRTFAIDSQTGILDYRGYGPLAADTSYITTDRNGRFLLGASWPGSKLSVSRIAPDGIGAPAHQVINTAPNMHCVQVDAANRHALAACTHGDIFYQWRFDLLDGLLTANDPPFVSVEVHSGPRHFVFHPNGRNVYLLSEHASRIYVYDYDAEYGVMSEQQVADPQWPPAIDKPKPRSHEIPWAVRASDIHVTADGRFLYASERGSSALAMFAVDLLNGRLSLIGHIETERQPRGFAISPESDVLYCAGQSSGRISVYAINRDNGQLSRIRGYDVGDAPNWIEVVQFP